MIVPLNSAKRALAFSQCILRVEPKPLFSTEDAMSLPKRKSPVNNLAMGLIDPLHYTPTMLSVKVITWRALSEAMEMGSENRWNGSCSICRFITCSGV